MDGRCSLEIQLEPPKNMEEALDTDAQLPKLSASNGHYLDDVSIAHSQDPM